MSKPGWDELKSIFPNFLGSGRARLYKTWSFNGSDYRIVSTGSDNVERAFAIEYKATSTLEEPSWYLYFYIKPESPMFAMILSEPLGPEHTSHD